MAGVSTPEMVAEANRAGGLGSLGAAVMSPEEIRKAIRRIRELSGSPFNINLFVPTVVDQRFDAGPYIKKIKEYEQVVGFKTPMQAKMPPFTFEEQVAVLLEEKVPVFSFTFGIPSPKIIQAFKSINTVVIGSATNLQEAVKLEKAGVDYIACQGSEAGGHRGTFIGSFFDGLIPALEFIRQLKGKVKVPLIGAGGITNGKQAAEFLKAGAAAVQIGTLFITAKESSASEPYRHALLHWKDKPRFLQKRFLDVGPALSKTSLRPI